MSNPQPTTLGKKRDNVKLHDATADDVFKDSPFYAFGEGTETLSGLVEGSTICGIMRDLRTSRKANSSGQRSSYVCMELEGGERIRIMAPTQLANTIRDSETGHWNIPRDSYVELTYKGLREPMEGGRAYHFVEVQVGEGTVN